MTAPANSEECLLELRGRTIVDVLINAFPFAYRTLLLDDGTGFTWSNNGTFWREDAATMKGAVDTRLRKLEKDQEELQRLLDYAEAVGCGERPGADYR